MRTTMLLAAIMLATLIKSQPYTVSVEIGAGDMQIDNLRSNLHSSDIRPLGRFPEPGLVLGVGLMLEPRDRWLLGLRGHGQFHPLKRTSGVDVGLLQYQGTARVGYVLYRENRFSMAPLIGVGGSAVAMDIYNGRNNNARYGNSTIAPGDIRRYRIAWLAPEVGLNMLYWPKGTGIGPGIGLDLGFMGTTHRSRWVDARTGYPVGGVGRGTYEGAWFTFCFVWRGNN
jgi:hypothetical protein